MNGQVWFITGTSRGIGLEMTRQLLESPANTVVAACRTPSKASALHELGTSAKGTLHIVAVDVDDRESIHACAAEVARILGDKGVDYVINNAGVNTNREDHAFTMDVDAMLKNLHTNVAGPAHVAQAFSALLARSGKKTLVNISSVLGSNGTDYGATHASYSVSKAALNMLTTKQAKERPDLTVISLCPGWLQTEMGGPKAPHPVPVGVAGLLHVIQTLTPDKSGTFFNFEGKELPW